VAGERRRDYMVNNRVHMLYMMTWVNSGLLVTAFGVLVFSLVRTQEAIREVDNLALFGVINPFLLLGFLAFVIVCTSLGLGVYTIIHTHRLMGSAYRIGVVLREINEGKPTRVKLRDGDFFVDIGDEINALADRAPPPGGATTPEADAPAPSEPTPDDKPAADAGEPAEGAS